MATYVFTLSRPTVFADSLIDIQPGWSIVEAPNGRNRMDFSLLSLDGSFRVLNDDIVKFTEDGITIFGGLIDNPGESGFGGVGSSDAIVQRLGAVDFNVYPSRITVGAATDRPSESLEDRLTWIVGLMSAQGVTLDAAQVTGPTLPAQSYPAGRYLVDVLTEACSLASGTGSTSFGWNISYDSELLAVESDTGTNPSPIDIADGDEQVDGDIVVEEPRPSDYGNYIVVLGGQGTKDRSDAFTGDGVTVTFPLTYTFATGYGGVTVNGVFETLGTLGLATWSYDSATNSITRTSAPAAAAAISITYLAAFPLRVFADGGLPAGSRKENTYTEPDVFDKDVLQALADSYLTRDIQSPKIVRYALMPGLTGVHPGQVQTITSAKRNLSGSHALTEVRIQHVIGVLVRRSVTAVSTKRLPSSLRQRFQQTFGGGSGAASVSNVTVITGGTYLSSPASLGGSDTTWRVCDTPTRVPNAQPYDAPATMPVTVQGLVSARVAATNVTVHLWDETDAASEFSDTPVSSGPTPVPFSFSGTVTIGHRYWLYVESGTAGVSATAVGQVTT